MQRRKFLIGAGSLAAAGAAAMGSGAFTSVEATRTVNVETAADTNAYLQMDPGQGVNSAYTEQTDGTVQINLDGSDNTSGGGVNKDAVSNFLNLFEVRNQGTQDVVVYVHPEPGVGVSPVTVTAEGGPGDTREFPDPGSGDGDVYIDPQATDMPNQSDTFSLTGIYGSGMPEKILENETSIDPNLGAPNSGNQNPGTALSDRVLGSGESFMFGLNVQHAVPADFPDDISIKISAKASLTP